MIQHVTGLQCTLCGQIYSPSEVEYVCPKHGSDGNLDILYDYERIAANVKHNGLPDTAGMWRYKALLPIDASAPVPPLWVGATPLYEARHVAKELGVGQVWLKDDGRNPTASLKDRASALIVAKAQAEERSIVTTASTGNAAAALAGLAASVRLPNVIFVPASAPEAKITQLLVYGARVLLVEGTYDDAFDLCLAASRYYGWYCRNTGYNPYTAEGKKTVAYEICEQISGIQGKFKAPDCIVTSVGDGNIISGVHKGLKDLLALGWIDHMPRLIGIQADGSAAMYQAWKDNIDPSRMQPIDAHTVADSISAGLPRDRVKAMSAVKDTGGAFLIVNDDEILAAIPALAQSTGVFAEPAASAAYAGLHRAAQDGLVGKDDRVIVLITGNGLKDIISARKAVTQAVTIKPDLSDVERVMDALSG
ncbi:MAG: threonine synthase [Anaerolineae bacterium]|nr:threonine synthase [Anaerolineae bacterium]